MTETVKADDVVRFSLKKCNDDLAAKLKSEVIVIRSPIYMGLDDLIRVEIERMANGVRRLPKLTVMLETTGGLVEVVERINNVFRKHFKEVHYVVPGYAYSAGTVLALSGDDIHMDYYSVLGPIDPQIQNGNGEFVPGMGILYMYDELVEKSKNETISPAELLFLTRQFDPATMFIIQQAKNHAEDLIKEWLPKYKFKDWKITGTRKKAVSMADKKRRAAQIAEVLGNAKKWHSHGRGITMRELQGSEIKLKISDFGQDADLGYKIRRYYELFLDYGQKINSQYAIHNRFGLQRVGS